MTAEFHKLTLRIPMDLKTWLATKSKLNASSLGSEVVRAVREAMEREIRARHQS